MKTSLKLLAGAAICSMLASCAHDHSTTGSIADSGTGGGVTVTPTPTAVPKLADVVKAGTSLSGTAPEMLENKSQGTVGSDSATVTANLLKDTQGNASGLHVTVAEGAGSNSYDLTTIDSTRSEISSADGTTTFAIETGDYGSGAKDTVDELADDTATSHYHTILGYSSTASGDTNERGYVALGSETTAANMPTSATATYVGKAHVDIDPTTGFAGGGNSRDSVKGAMTLSADFAKDTVDGTVSDVKARLGSNASFASVTGGAMTIGAGKISGDNITATMSPNAAVTTAIGHDFTGDVAAKFYGPNADEIGGTVTVQGAGVTGVGFITANKQ